MRWSLCVLLLACGPQVESSDEGDGGTTGDGTTSAGTSTSTSGPETTSTTASTLTTSADVTTVPPTSSTDESGSSTVEPQPICEAEGSESARFVLDGEGAFELGTDCDVVDFGNGLDSVLITLDCGAAGEQTIHGSGFDVEALLEPHPRVEVRATGLGSQWSHLAVYDLSGGLLFGTYDLSPMAEDVREWFTPLQWEVVVDVCELELDRTCPQERIAIDFSHQGDVARIYDRNAGELAGYEIVPTGVREHPDATMDCPAEPTLRGWFTVHQLQ